MYDIHYIYDLSLQLLKFFHHTYPERYSDLVAVSASAAFVGCRQMNVRHGESESSVLNAETDEDRMSSHFNVIGQNATEEVLTTPIAIYEPKLGRKETTLSLLNRSH